MIYPRKQSLNDGHCPRPVAITGLGGLVFVDAEEARNSQPQCKAVGLKGHKQTGFSGPRNVEKFSIAGRHRIWLAGWHEQAHQPPKIRRFSQH
jgi:hypothetical protein